VNSAPPRFDTCRGRRQAPCLAELLARTDHATYCPYKGDCAYYSIPLGGVRSTNAVWTYESSYAAVAAIRDYLAFYPDRVDAIEERPGDRPPFRRTPRRTTTLRWTAQ
jgi:hypothetical protein